MTDKPDTSADAVEALVAALSGAGRQALARRSAQATLRALLAERDAARAEADLWRERAESQGFMEFSDPPVADGEKG